MKMWSLRLWTREDLTLSPFQFIDAFERRSNLKVENFNIYGLDGSSYRIDLRFDASTITKERIQNFVWGRLLTKKEKWSRTVLQAELHDWKEPDDVKRGMNLGSLLARRFHQYNLDHPKAAIKVNAFTMSHFTAFLLNSLWGMGMLEIPYWHKENDEKKFAKAFNYMVTPKGPSFVEPNFAVIERTVHNFLQGVLPFGESQVWMNLMQWTIMSWWASMAKFGLQARKGGGKKQNG